jgi:hypothetical protein
LRISNDTVDRCIDRELEYSRRSDGTVGAEDNDPEDEADGEYVRMMIIDNPRYLSIAEIDPPKVDYVG